MSNKSNGGCGCLTILVLLWLVFGGGCAAIRNWTADHQQEHGAKP